MRCVLRVDTAAREERPGAAHGEAMRTGVVRPRARLAAISTTRPRKRASSAIHVRLLPAAEGDGRRRGANAAQTANDVRNAAATFDADGADELVTCLGQVLSLPAPCALKGRRRFGSSPERARSNAEPRSSATAILFVSPTGASSTILAASALRGRGRGQATREERRDEGERATRPRWRAPTVRSVLRVRSPPPRAPSATGRAAPARVPHRRLRARQRQNRPESRQQRQRDETECEHAAPGEVATAVRQRPAQARDQRGSPPAAR